jgi:uncharacterized protein YjeT (DUF2065 family)
MASEYKDPAFEGVSAGTTPSSSQATSSSSSSEPFSALRRFGSVIVAVGYLGLFLAVMLALVGLSQVMDSDVGLLSVVSFIQGVGLWMLASLLLAAAGHALRCFAAVEANTRRVLDVLDQRAGRPSGPEGDGETTASSEATPEPPEDEWQCRCGRTNPPGTEQCENCYRSHHAFMMTPHTRR